MAWSTRLAYFLQTEQNIYRANAAGPAEGSALARSRMPVRFRSSRTCTGHTRAMRGMEIQRHGFSPP